MKNLQMFQCPTSGFLLFYSVVANSTIKSQDCFNALPRAFFFSTFLELENVNEIIKSFNALPRAFFFSTFMTSSKDFTAIMAFQCPTSGFLLFYDGVSKNKTATY